MRKMFTSAVVLTLGLSQIGHAQSSESATSVSKAYQQYERDRDAQRAHQEILNAIEAAKSEITSLIQKLEERQLKACADASGLEFANFLKLEKSSKEIISGKYLSCIAQAYRTINEEPYDMAIRYAGAFHVLNLTTMFMQKSLDFDVHPLAQLGVDVTNLTDRAWKAKTGLLRQLDVGEDGEVWGVNDSQSVFRWNGSTWVQPNAEARLAGITVGSKDNIWGVTKDGVVYRRVGSSWVAPNPDARLIQVSAAADGEVWGVAPNNTVWRWNGSSWYTPLESARLGSIAVGSRNNVWGVGTDGTVWRWTGNTWTVPVAGARLKQVSVNAAGEVWGVNTGVYRWNNSGWYQPNPEARLVHIAVGKDGNVWGTNSAANIFSRDFANADSLYSFYLNR